MDKGGHVLLRPYHLPHEPACGLKGIVESADWLQSEEKLQACLRNVTQMQMKAPLESMRICFINFAS